MPIAAAMLPEFDHEMQTTRSLLERVPEADADWKPHEKSMSLGQLSAHLANLPFWGSLGLRETEFDMNPPDGRKFETPGFESTAKVLEIFDHNVAEARDALASASDEDLMVGWSLKNGGHTIFTLPRVAVLRSFVVNHVIHHRGQLSVYLRLRDVPLPSIYGPSADSPM